MSRGTSSAAIASEAAGQEPGRAHTHANRDGRGDPNSRENVKGGDGPGAGAQGGDGRGQQLDGGGVEHRKQTQIVRGGAGAVGHQANRLDAQRRGGVPQPEDIGTDVCRNCLADSRIPTGGRHEPLQDGTQQSGELFRQPAAAQHLQDPGPEAKGTAQLYAERNGGPGAGEQRV